MKMLGFSEERIALALKPAETGTSVAEVIRRMGISDQTFYRRKKVQTCKRSRSAARAAWRVLAGEAATFNGRRASHGTRFAWD